jgi:hypothetical protein
MPSTEGLEKVTPLGDGGRSDNPFQRSHELREILGSEGGIKRLQTGEPSKSNPHGMKSFNTRVSDEVRIYRKWRTAMGCFPTADKPAPFTKLDAPIKVFCWALWMVIAKMQFRCVRPKNNAMGPILLAPKDGGILVYITQQSPWHLHWWLRSHGEEIQDMRGYILDGEQLCNYLIFWLCMEPENGDKIDVEGVLGETDHAVFLQRKYGEFLFAFDDICFDSVGQKIVERVNEEKKLREKPIADKVTVTGSK